MGSFCEFRVILKNGKPFLRLTYIGKNFSNVDEMKIYGLSSKPYVKRLSEKMYLEPYMLKQLQEITA